MTGPLEGVRVVDVTRMVAGPVAAWYLAALGAEVIRVEQPGGDLTWASPPFVGPDGVHDGPRRPEDIALAPLRRGRGKRNVVLKLRTPRGQEILRELVAASDVLIENFRVGVLAELGLDDATLAEQYPRLVVCSITGWGRDGPYRDRPAMDMVVQAVAGLMGKSGFPDGPPVKSGVMIGDHVPALFATIGTLAALHRRDATGRGGRVDVSMLDALLALMWDEPIDHFRTIGLPERTGNRDSRGSPVGAYATNDGWVAVVCTNDTQWRRIATLIGRPDLAPLAHGQRKARGGEIDDAMSAWAAGCTTTEAAAGLEGTDVPSGPVQRAWAASEDPHVAATGSLVELRHADATTGSGYLGPTLPIRIDGVSATGSPAEPLGASTDAVLAEILGYNADAIAALRAEGIVGADPVSPA